MGGRREEIPNYFEPDWVARRYAIARPDVHSQVVARLQMILSSDTPLRAALDVGCGTGLSTRPLRAIAECVIGVDPASFMLREARQDGGASYVRGRAEELPFGSSLFDLVSIGCAYHWCNPDSFLSEAHRVLLPDSYLVIYDNFFFGELPRSSTLYDWLTAEYWARLPRTPRHPLPEIDSFTHPSFELVDSCFVETWVPMSRDSLVAYLTTQSGAVAAVESGTRTLADIESSLHSGLSALVPEQGSEFRFGGPVWVARRVS